MELTVDRRDWLVQLGLVCCHRQVRPVGLFLNLLIIISLYLLIQDENVHGNSILLLFVIIYLPFVTIFAFNFIY